ncbi:alpha-ketoacid dehydrogenase subunit beta [Jiangella asiatica]|uniref:Alpha-ketoacid dehydrogenase subunit beta n=2 Tax=Jiangella asiatica TaxID=2530372 RepID=A0A4R5DD87_9ACTN|nr:alpha-ketoacid dehydrogenase subunit beta [Jiangella asiatica]
MNQAVSAALADAMREDPAVVVIGEDVAVPGGVFKATDGLLAEFGVGRVRDTPISEMGFLGAAVGAAATGLRPVVEIMFGEFLGVALDQLVTEAAKLRYLSAGQYGVPLTVRASVGAGLGFGAQHSQCLETWFYATPGLKVAVASGPQTAYGLLRAAVRDDDPVVVLEPRRLYGGRAEVVTGDDGIIALGSAEVRTAGDDVTLVALGGTVPVAQEAADGAGWGAEVVDLRTLVPWDVATVLDSVRRTGRLVVVEEGPFSGGWGTEIAARVASELFGELRAPVHRVTSPDVPVPYAKPLETRYVPTVEYVREQVGELIETGRTPRPWWSREGAHR